MGNEKKNYHIRDLIIDDEYGTISNEATVEEVAKKMKELDVPDLVVLEKGSDKVLGVVADFDIVQNIVADGLDPKTTKATAAMYTIEPVTLNTKVEEAFSKMQELHVNVVPVIEKKKLIGVVTLQDCWGFIPDETVDEIGLIPVPDPKTAEFWFAGLAAILALILGMVFPLAGITGFYKGDFLGNPISYYLFEAHSSDYRTAYMNMNGAMWIVTVICSFLVIFSSIFGVFALLYVSYSDSKTIKTAPVLRYIIPALPIVFLVFEWIFIKIALNVSSIGTNVKIDALGLIMTIFAILFYLGAIFRDYAFRQTGGTPASTNQVNN
ncbi:hypothetical protein NEF87_001692 [Candidatus Lokiarchaeum ossiferum]|uniref:CBS domain-containing protein n=1 Tax=Candidatus Lokiarchaeum ossiferum TaxID=2951803 RepID=A0ABY6HPI2_9ARCH|nr:hypothetical protein NEF87_001692 [Candidatus Lokiarchaeum sp. B-35]